MNEIAKYNDLIRQSLLNSTIIQQLKNAGCRYEVNMTASVHHTIKNKTGLLQAIATFDQFNEDNDPYGEHDFLNFTFEDQTINAKFDYFAPDLEHGSENPQDLNKTIRVLTIMLARDY